LKVSGEAGQRAKLTQLAGSTDLARRKEAAHYQRRCNETIHVMYEMTIDINPARDVHSNAGAAAGQTNTHTHHATKATIMMVPPTIIM